LSISAYSEGLFSWGLFNVFSQLKAFDIAGKLQAQPEERQFLAQLFHLADISLLDYSSLSA
jgi:hypothetical protein